MKALPLSVLLREFMKTGHWRFLSRIEKVLPRGVVRHIVTVRVILEDLTHPRATVFGLSLGCPFDHDAHCPNPFRPAVREAVEEGTVRNLIEVESDRNILTALHFHYSCPHNQWKQDFIRFFLDEEPKDYVYKEGVKLEEVPPGEVLADRMIRCFSLDWEQPA